MAAYTAITRRVLVVCTDAAHSQAIEGAIRPWLFETVVCASLQDSADLLAKQDFSVIFCEDRLEQGSYPELLSLTQRSYKVPVVVMISDVDHDEIFREAMGLGAFGVIASPCSAKDVKWMVIQATRSDGSSSKPRVSSRRISMP